MRREFRNIKGYENYLISNTGDIINSSRGYKGLKTHDNGKGYIGVGLTRGGKTRRFLVHRLVAEAFLPNPEGKKTVNHINEDKANNNLENLEWATQLENIRHSVDEKYFYSQQISQYSSRGEIIAVWNSAIDTEKCGFVRDAIKRCCKNIDETYKGFKWKFGIDNLETANSHFIDMRGVV